MTIDLVAPVGRPIAPAHPPAGRKEREAHLAEQVAEILGDRLDGERAAIAAAAAARWVVSDFRQFQIWARSFDYGELPACGAVVACYQVTLSRPQSAVTKTAAIELPSWGNGSRGTKGNISLARSRTPFARPTPKEAMRERRRNPHGQNGRAYLGP
jgi:hypothetical protein